VNTDHRMGGIAMRRIASGPLHGARLRSASLALALALALVCTAVIASSAEAATPAWKVLAVTGPTNLPPRQSETQRVIVEAEDGTFTLSQTTAKGSGKLSFGSGTATRAEASNELTGANILSGGPLAVGQTVTGTGIPAGTTITSIAGSTLTLSAPATGSGLTLISVASKEVTAVSTSLGSFHPGDAISGTGIPVGATIASVGSGTLTLSTLPTATGTPALTATETTAAISYDASAAALQSAFEALPAFESEGLAVSGGPGGDAEHPYLVTFGGPYADTNVETLIAKGETLVGAHANVQISTKIPGGAGTGEIAIYPTNIGGAPTSGTITVELGQLPTGIVTSGASSGSGWTCPGGAGATTVTCTRPASLPAMSASNPVAVPIEVKAAAPPSSTVMVTVSGGGGGTATYGMPLVVSTKHASPGVQAFWAGAFDENGKPAEQAGGHPFSALADFQLDTLRLPTGKIVSVGDPRTTEIDLPPGFIGDPLVTKRCPPSLITPPSPDPGGLVCGAESIIGSLSPKLIQFGQVIEPTTVPIYNDVPPSGSAAGFAAVIGGPVQTLVGSVRSEDDFGVRVTAINTPTYSKLFGAFAALQGDPAAAHGDALLTSPTDCPEQAREAPMVTIEGNIWQPADVFEEGFVGASEVLPAVTGCQALTSAWLGQGPEPEKPSFSFQPTTTQGSSGTGATATLHIPQTYLSKIPSSQEKLEGIVGNATADLKKTVVTLPQGLSVNPSSANGLEACTEAQVGYKKPGEPDGEPLPLNPIRFDEEPVACPDASKLGTFAINSPLLEEEVEGTIYLAAQEENPFHSLIALYLVVENERFGLTLKLPGEVRPDPSTGQLTATFDDNPQLPFEDLILHFRGGGPRSTLATPETCGHFTTTGSLEPWSAEHGEALPISEAGFSTTGACSPSDSTRPFAPSFEAGTSGIQAGAYSPLVIKVARKDGEQELKSLDFTLPKGLTGKLAGIPYCSDAAIAQAGGKSGKAEQANPSCPAASRLGSVDTSAGYGSEPVHVGGNVYLAGPYEGAPLSSVVITPAVAGPFDLGDVVVRAPLYVDPETTRITAKSDPIPTILRGIPLKVRSVAINLDRSAFTLNPTSCEPSAVTASIGSSNGATASPSTRFQVGACNALKFKPTLKLSLKGSTKHTGHPALKAVVTYPKKGAYANIARAQVNLPHSEFLDQGNLNKTCTRPVLLAGNCPKSTIYGKAKAWTPLLEAPLEGNVYLVGGYGFKLPALVADLNGQIRVTLIGKVDSGPNRGIRNTFEAVPDAPVSRFVLEMKGGKKYSLLENSENLCKKAQRGIARFTAQNGLVQQTKPLIANDCGKKKGKGGGKGPKKAKK
jgi:hypothetical protein